MSEIHQQLRLFGLDTVVQRRPQDRRLAEAAHEVMSEPDEGVLAFLHSGLCQTALPHSKPASNTTIWERRAGRLTLVVQPGTSRTDHGTEEFVGVPYGTKARHIMFYLQTEGTKGPVISLGTTMSAWMRSLGLQVSGGANGTIRAIKEQILRIANCSIKFEWEQDTASGAVLSSMTRTTIVRGLNMWAESRGRESWPSQVELSAEFYEHLKMHAVPLDKRAIARLSNSALGLDLYVMFVYRLPRLEQPKLLTWQQLQQQFGADFAHNWAFAEKVRKTLPMVLAVYEDAKVELDEHRRGLILHPSRAAVPRSMALFTTTLRGRR